MADDYSRGETDAIVRQNRGYFRLLDDDETPSDRKQILTAVIAANYRRLDRYLSAGKPLPTAWVHEDPEGTGSVDLTGSEEGEARGRTAVEASCNGSLSAEGARA